MTQPLNKNDSTYLWDMLDAANAINNFIASRTYTDYANDKMFRSAVERQLEIIGEAANKVSKVFQDAHSEIPWRNIIAQRHILIHEYAEIKYELVWKVATIHILDLIGKLTSLIPSPSSN